MFTSSVRSHSPRCTRSARIHRCAAPQRPSPANLPRKQRPQINDRGRISRASTNEGKVAKGRYSPAIENRRSCQVTRRDHRTAIGTEAPHVKIGARCLLPRLSLRHVHQNNVRRSRPSANGKESIPTSQRHDHDHGRRGRNRLSHHGPGGGEETADRAHIRGFGAFARRGRSILCRSMGRCPSSQLLLRLRIQRQREHGQEESTTTAGWRQWSNENDMLGTRRHIDPNVPRQRQGILRPGLTGQPTMSQELLSRHHRQTRRILQGLSVGVQEGPDVRCLRRILVEEASPAAVAGGDIHHGKGTVPR
mmetsp:Transcript_4523/g.10024  ORF Transcript_4523/g.10024 Transcript_4523/m.10024 type:complete len:306 (+) Transcript_4523:586-1503(+)